MLISHSIQQATRFNCKKVYGCNLVTIIQHSAYSNKVTRKYLGVK